MLRWLKDRAFWRRMQRGVDQAAVAELYYRATGDGRLAREARAFTDIMVREFDELRPPECRN
jgi:hypothetical protein